MGVLSMVAASRKGLHMLKLPGTKNVRSLIAGGVMLALASCGATPSTNTTGPATTATVRPAEEAPFVLPTDQSEIVAIARMSAARLGEESPTDIEWTYSTREEVVQVVSDSYLADATGDALVIQMRGEFVLANAHGGMAGRAAGPPSGRALVVVLDSETGLITDRSILTEACDLSLLGEVHTE